MTFNNIFEQFGANFNSKSKPILNREFIFKMFDDNPRRAKHILGVVDQVDEWLKPVAYLHDIGYSTKIPHPTGFHPIDGAIYAWECGYVQPIVMAVLFHSGANGEASFTPSLSEFYKTIPVEMVLQYREFIDGITYFDMRTSPDGFPVTLEDRINEILKRYPSGHQVHENIKRQTPYFKQIPRPSESFE